MTEDQINQAQASGNITTVTPEVQLPPTDTTLADLKKQMNTYLPYLEKLRTGVTVAAKIYLGASNQTITNTVPYVVVNCTYLAFASGITADLTNKRLVIQTAGTYVIYGKVDFIGASSNILYIVAIYINGSLKASPQTLSGNPPYADGQVMSIYKLNAGDYIELRVQASGNQATSGSEDVTYLLAFKL